MSALGRPVAGNNKLQAMPKMLRGSDLWTLKFQVSEDELQAMLEDPDVSIPQAPLSEDQLHAVLGSCAQAMLRALKFLKGPNLTSYPQLLGCCRNS